MAEQVVKLNAGTERSALPVFSGLRVLAVLNTALVKTHISNIIAALDGVEVEFVPENSALSQELDRRPDAPDALLIETAEPAEALKTLRELRSSMLGARVFVCVLTHERNESATVELLREGADDVLPVTSTAADLSASFARATAAHRGRRAAPTGAGLRTVAFMHASGGAGATTLAVNSAVYLHSLLKGSEGGACLLDMDLQFGTADLQLDLPIRSKVIDLVKMPERLDTLMLQELMVDGPDGLRVLTAPETLLPVDVLAYRTVENVLAIARRRFRYVVVDLPHALTTWTDVVLRRADRVFLVTQVNVLGLRVARRLLDTLAEEGIPTEHVRVIANRHPAKGLGKRVSIRQAEDALGMPISAEVPSDFKLIVESLDQGVPACRLKPKSKFSKAIGSMMREFEDELVESRQASEPGLSGLRR